MSLESERQSLHFILESHFRQPSEVNGIMELVALKSLACTYTISRSWVSSDSSASLNNHCCLEESKLSTFHSRNEEHTVSPLKLGLQLKTEGPEFISTSVSDQSRQPGQNRNRKIGKCTARSISILFRRREFSLTFLSSFLSSYPLSSRILA